MKKLLLALPILLGMFSTFTVRSQWLEEYVPFGFEGYFFDIQAVDGNVCWGTPWIVTNSSTGAVAYSRKYARTIDAGGTWTVDSITSVPTNYQISNIWPINGNTCYLAMNTGTVRGGVYKTINGGTTWTQVGSNMFTNANSFPDFVYFWNAKYGMALGDPIGATRKFEIYTTSDSGATWVAVPTANIPAAQTSATDYGITNLFTVSRGHVWFASTFGDVYHSADTGKTWTKSASGFTPVTYSTGARQDVSDLAFTDGMHGIITSLDTSAVLHVKQTSDGGMSWVDITPSGPMYVADLDVVPWTNVMVSVGSNNNFGFGSSVSFDYGLTWTNLDTNVSHIAVSFADSANGWTGEYVLSTNTTGGAFQYIGAPLAVINHFDKTKETQVYPNPSANGIFNVLGASKTRTALFQVFTMEGREVYNEAIGTLSVYRHELNLSNLSSGLYILKVTDGQTSSQHKLMIQ